MTQESIHEKTGLPTFPNTEPLVLRKSVGIIDVHPDYTHKDRFLRLVRHYGGRGLPLVDRIELFMGELRAFEGLMATITTGADIRIIPVRYGLYPLDCSSNGLYDMPSEFYNNVPDGFVVAAEVPIIDKCPKPNIDQNDTSGMKLTPQQKDAMNYFRRSSYIHDMNVGQLLLGHLRAPQSSQPQSAQLWYVDTDLALGNYERPVRRS